MDEKAQIITDLQEEFDRWEELLSNLSEEQITARNLPGGWSIKDTMAHLWTWQQRSIARLEAARLNREPVYPEWPVDADPEAEGSPDVINPWIFETNRDRPWISIYQDWRAGFRHFMDLAQSIPERDLFTAGKYPWLGEYSLADVLKGSYEHHHEEHLVPLLTWLEKAGDL